MAQDEARGGGRRRTPLGPAKALTGIPGLDRITHGGLPRGRLTLLLGGAGTGKTVLALQTLVCAARDYGEPGIFVALEETSAHVRENAASFGWGLPALEGRLLLFVDAHLPVDVLAAGDFDVVGLLEDLRAIVARIGARRIVFDGIEALLGHVPNPSAERREFYRLHEWVCGEGLVGIITAREGQHGEPLEARHGFWPHLASVVLRLDQRVGAPAAARSCQIIKYRGSAHHEGACPLTIGPAGVRIGPPGVP